MRTAIARFLQYMTVERNASAYTIKSYREDLTALTWFGKDGSRYEKTCSKCEKPQVIQRGRHYPFAFV